MVEFFIFCYEYRIVNTKLKKYRLMCSIVKYKDLYINAFDIHQTNHLIDYLELLVDEKKG